jgi:uncharacterized protein
VIGGKIKMITGNSTLVKPISPSERIVSLDVIRGLAVIGILLVNIQIFSMIFISYLNPTSFGDMKGFNYIVAMLTYIFAELKFMPIFSLLFGVGIFVMARNIETRGQKPAGLHYRRMLWLFLFGLMHAYLLFFGDILVRYAICGAVAFLFRKLSPKKILIIGLIVLFIGSAITIKSGLAIQDLPQKTIEEINKYWFPGEKIIAEEIDAFLGSWWEQMEYRSLTAFSLQTDSFFGFGLWRVLGMMLIGMAFFKWGILAEKKSNRFYRNMLIICGSIGLFMEVSRWILNSQYNWAYKYVMFQGFLINYWGGLFLCLAYAAGIILICRSRFFQRFTRWLAAMGRMALTHYLMQSIICTTLFYGHGFGLMGKVSRTWQFLIVFLIVVFQAWVSVVWLKYFRFGPAEWVWRSLTYRKIQPLKT